MRMNTRLGALLAALALAAAGPALAAKAKKPAPKKAAPAKAVAPAPEASSEIELAHRLTADKADPLRKLVDRFNAGSDRKIVLAERDWAEGALPAMMLVAPDDVGRFLDGKPRYRPVYQVMKEAGEPLQTLKPMGLMGSSPLDAKGNLLGLPIGLGTPIMFYNRDAFKKAGLDPEQPPKTWWDLQQALGKLYDAGFSCPYTSSYPEKVHVENVSAWHNEPVVAVGGKKEGPLVVNNMLMVKHVAMMSSWYKSRYLHIFGPRDEADAKFAMGECAVLTASSDRFPTLTRFAKFQVGASPLPYHDDIPGAPQNTLADGSVLWVGQGRKPADYKTIAKFLRFMLTPESQVEWQVNAGYLPLNQAGVLAASSDLLKSELIHIRTAVDQLIRKPATEASKASRYIDRADVRRILNEELDAVWAGTKPPKAALDAAVARSRSLN
jgi:sn-glycerol 3-phosphate transport system substrate-binding protein